MCRRSRVKGAATPWPRLESDRHLMSTGSARPLEDAFRISQVDLVQWVGEAWGLDRLDAYQLLTQAAELYGGMHDRLRQLGRDHLASGGTGPR
jgi:hypothetical protein